MTCAPRNAGPHPVRALALPGASRVERMPLPSYVVAVVEAWPAVPG